MRSLEFHKIFAKTQATAQSLAEAFNAKVEDVRLASRSTRLIPRIQFLPCTIYRVYDNDGSIREVCVVGMALAFKLHAAAHSRVFSLLRV